MRNKESSFSSTPVTHSPIIKLDKNDFINSLFYFKNIQSPKDEYRYEGYRVKDQILSNMRKGIIDIKIKILDT